MKFLIIIIISTIIGFFIGKIVFQKNILDLTTNNEIKNNDSLTLKKPVKNEIKTITKIPYFIKRDIKALISNSENINLIVWHKFLDQYVKNNSIITNTSTFNGDSLAHIAIKSGNIELLKYISKKGISLSEKNEQGISPIMLAFNGNNLDIIRYLLTKGVDLAEKDNEGRDLLNISLESNSYDHLKQRKVDILLENGFSFDNEQQYFISLLRNGNKKYLEKYTKNLNLNYDINDIKDNMSYALQNTSNEIILNQFLEKYIPSKSESGFNLIHASLTNLDLSDDFFYKLISLNLDVNEKVILTGQTPLMYSILNKQFTKAKILLENGADMTLLDNYGNDVYDIVKRSKILTKKEKENFKILFDKHKKETYE